MVSPEKDQTVDPDRTPQETEAQREQRMAGQSPGKNPPEEVEIAREHQRFANGTRHPGRKPTLQDLADDEEYARRALIPNR